ncbi:ABC transporter, permease protein [Formosa sp. Hel1_33_131]|uniref:ABC transporter permease n=1 Tax=Formosa sp. Hel1_33_131 TaxID=1336794 RepID=UPI00084E2435|nr:FtsX-like permease family protein [Formosa sp. Hel1_33_131]AOR29145.1 ABC transporter, permease protein [Formosa sp. Hel1_33_131]
MNYEYFLAKRIIGNKSYKSSVSAPIIKIGIAAIAISTIVMLIAIATGIGLEHKIRDKAVAFNGHITISNFDSNESEGSQVPVSKNQNFYPEFNSVEGVSHIQAVANKFGIIRTNTDFEGLFLKGVGTDYDWRYFKEFLIEGRLPTYTQKYSNEVLISKYLADRLGFVVGETFQMYFMKSDSSKPPSIMKYAVVGIFNSGFEELDKTYVIGDINHVQRLNRWTKDQIGNFEVFITNYNDLDRLGKEVYAQTPSTLDAMTVKQKYATIFEWIPIFTTNIYGIIGIMILVGAINMITALLVLILERTQMIGILKALGSSNWSIRKLFLYNASYLIACGLFWGNLIGIGVLLLQKQFEFLKLDPSVYYVTVAPVYLDWTYVVLLNLMTFVLCLLMLLIPSFLISKIVPVKAIQFE